MKKLSSFFSILLIVSLIVTGCATKQDTSKAPQEAPATSEGTKEAVNVNIAGLKGPTSIGMIKLFDEKAMNSDEYKVSYEAYDAPDTVLPKILKGEVQIAAVPTNVASILFNKSNGNIQFLAENTLGILYLVGTDDISDIGQLEGKTITTSGKGTVVEYAINYILAQNGLTDKVTIDYQPDHATVAQMLIAGDVDLAIEPQPFVAQITAKKPEIKILLDITKEWDKASNGESILSMGCLVINKEFAENNREFVSEFLSEYEQSVKFVNENPKEASELVEKNGIIANAAAVEKAIPYCNIVYKSAQDAKDEVNAFLKVLFDSNNASIGGQLPDETFYYEQ